MIFGCVLNELPLFVHWCAHMSVILHCEKRAIDMLCANWFKWTVAPSPNSHWISIDCYCYECTQLNKLYFIGTRSAHYSLRPQNISLVNSILHHLTKMVVVAHFTSGWQLLNENVIAFSQFHPQKEIKWTRLTETAQRGKPCSHVLKNNSREMVPNLWEKFTFTLLILYICCTHLKEWYLRTSKEELGGD